MANKSKPSRHTLCCLLIYCWSDEPNSSEVNEGCLCLAAADCLTVMNFYSTDWLKVGLHFDYLLQSVKVVLN